MTRRSPEGAFGAHDTVRRGVTLDEIDCDRCLPGMYGERIDTHAPGQVPCEHVAPAPRMTEPPAPGAAVQIAAQAVTRGWGAMRVPTDDVIAHTVVVALARAGWLHDPAEVARSERRALALRDEVDVRGRTLTLLRAEVAALRAVVDAAPATPARGGEAT